MNYLKKKSVMVIVVVVGFLAVIAMDRVGLTGEHPGEEHAGKAAEGQPAKEHAGKAAEGQPAKEHAGKAAAEHPGSKSKVFNGTEIKSAMKAHIDGVTKPNGGLLLIKDPKENNKELKLKFVKIHDPVREIKGKGYFACTDFQVEGDPAKLYDLDFWLNPKDGKLAVTETKIHKEPLLKDGKWIKKARYTFINDNPVVVP